ncbi:pyruvate dehydrogenase (acetyl-transferring) E1 component subunit alpha [Leifsonia kafniensis]|uniref:Pyruvate dehydrogenase (Acetyl-transferring) E1 component subunit alpha n=1 Tax=Leifsonia kafniensis TaxID=475957 RepID=A0ABP7L9N5_9MICO
MNDTDAAFVQLLTPDGVRVAAPEFDDWVADIGLAELGALYEDMVVVRRIDTEATALQRQGQLGLWAPLLGQEAAQIGSARTLRSDDFVFSSYRENGVAYCRGVGLTDLLRVWRGNTQSGWNPFEVGMATPAIIIGAQTLHATGYAVGCAFDGVDSATIAYFGDGATSEGDVNEAMVFAVSFKAPVVFFCQNNHWAISEPVGLQSAGNLADRAPGFGIPSLRVDGNDVLAVTAATRIALDRARKGGGPTFIEAVTYRMGPHTTADDPTRYRDAVELAEWADRDPILRVQRMLDAAGAFTPEFERQVASTADRVAAELRAGCVAMPDPKPLALFDNVYVTPQATLQRQRDDYAAYLDSFDLTSGAGENS